jgi:hypothetical protein
MPQELRLTIELVPQGLWGINLHKSGSAWDKLRKQVYAQYSYRCGICQTENATLSCHEIWQYDDALHIQKLNGFIALCTMCHHCKHMGRARILASEGKLDFNKVVEHFIRVNQCSFEEYEVHRKEAFKTWKERNKYAWTTDFGVYAHLVTPATEANNSG